MPNNPAILDGKKKDVFSNHFKSFSNLGRFYISAPSETDLPCPFPPDAALSGNDIQKLYGLYWLSK